MSVEHFSQVMHIGTTVAGELREDKDAIDAVDSILPAGTLSGAPKFRACQIIEELEQSTDAQFSEVYQALNQLLSKPDPKPRKPIGYRTYDE